MSEAITIEVCVETVEGARAAAEAGADRLELCGALAVGGITPGPGLLRATLDAVELPVVVLCRPRRGDFLYGNGDFDALARDVEAARDAGAAGVAIGALTADGRVDSARTAELVARAGDLEVCFHRAFDLVADLDGALETLVDLGVRRVLTSGGEPDVVQGLDRLAHLNARAAGRIEVLPGGGVTEHNARPLVDTTRVTQLHLSAGRTVASAMEHRGAVDLGAAALPGEYDLRVTDPDRIRALRAELGL